MSNPATGNQVTQWVYGVATTEGSEIDSNALLYRKLYPDSSTPVTYKRKSTFRREAFNCRYAINSSRAIGNSRGGSPWLGDSFRKRQRHLRTSAICSHSNFNVEIMRRESLEIKAWSG
jgi:hypothetical protein